MKRTILDKIFDTKRSRVDSARTVCPDSEVRERALRSRDSRAPGRFMDALSGSGSLNIIAEFKRASPSKGPINAAAEISEVVSAYEKGGARAISVLTEEDFFQGSLGDLSAARDITSLPILRKDFIFDEYQIWEAAAAGADAVLLIAAMLDDDTISSLAAKAGEFGLDTLVEVHTREALDRAAKLGARLIGVNNRDLNSFEVSLDVARELARHAPAEAVMVAESGLRSHEDLEELSSLGYRGFLVGETLMKSGDPESELRRLLGQNV